MNRLPVFKTYSDFHFQSFKKRCKLLLYWCYLYWGLLFVINAVKVIQQVRTSNSFIFDIAIVILNCIAGIFIIVILKKSLTSPKWYNIFEHSIFFFAICVSPIGLWYASTQQTTAESFLCYFQVSFAISCCLFITQRTWQKIVMYIWFSIAAAIFLIVNFQVSEALMITRIIVFTIFIGCSFGALNYALGAGNKEMLLELQNFWKASFEMIPDGFIILDGELSVKYHNSAFKSIFQGNRNSLENLANLPINLRKCLNPNENYAIDEADLEDCPSLSFKDFLKNKLNNNNPLEPSFGDFRMHHKNIEVRALRTYIEGYGDYYTAIFADVTARDKLAQLQDQNGFKDNLMKSVSHELRGPLNASMISIAKVLESQLTTEDRKILAIAYVCQTRLLKSIDGILDLVKITSKQLQLNLREFNIKKIAERTINLFSYLIQQKSLKFEFHVNLEETACICSDVERIEQVLYQIIDNSVKFTPAGGSISLSIQKMSQSINPQPETENVIIQLTDSGYGISAEGIKKVQAIFSRGVTREKISENSSGAGLGLMIVAGLLKKVGKDFQIRSEPRKGTSIVFQLRNLARAEVSQTRQTIYLDDDNSPKKELFTTVEKHVLSNEPEAIESDISEGKRLFQIPRNSEVQGSASIIEFPSIAERPTSRGLLEKNTLLTKQDLLSPLISNRIPTRSGNEKRQILIVDDDAFNIFALQSRLVQLGYQVLSAADGLEAIQILRRKSSPIELVLMDCNMPVLNGYEATKQLKAMMKNHEIAAIPIVACTAYAQESERFKCLKLGFDDFIVKPLDSESLKAILNKFLNDDSPVNIFIPKTSVMSK